MTATSTDQRATRRRPLRAFLLGFCLPTALLFVLAFHDAFFLLPDQKQLLTDLRREFSPDGMALLKDIYPIEDWDIVCIVPAYSFSGSSPTSTSEMKRYLGETYRYSWFTSPDPFSRLYGLGFAFLKDGQLHDFVMIPPGRRTAIHVPEYELHGQRRSEFHFSDLNVTPQERGRYCYPRDSAFLKFNSYQDITVGG